MKQVAIYARVSTKKQEAENQLLLLRQVAKINGWVVDDKNIYVDKITGSKGRDGRPQFDALCQAVESGEIKHVATWSIDRLGRNAQDLLAFLNMVHGAGCGLYMHQQGIDTSKPSGRFLFQMMGLMAEFERETIRERVLLGLERAKAEGKRLGRKESIRPETRERILQFSSQGYSSRQIEQMTGVSHSQVARIVKKEKAQAS